MAETKKKDKKSKKDKPGPGKVDATRFPKKIKHRNQIPRGAHRGMKLILVESVQHVGKQGEVVEVKPGYGRNFLLPQGLATYVTPEALVRIEKHKAAQESLRIAKLAELKVLARQVNDKSVTIETNATEEGHLYGSVTAHDIVVALEKENIKIEESFIKFEGSIRELGLYQLPVVFAEGVEAQVKVWVVPTGTKDAAK